jgi:hypothetical protein
VTKGLGDEIDSSEAHKQMCHDYCRRERLCVKCSTERGCGKGHDHLKTWGGQGKNWHACKERVSRSTESGRNKAACENWCRGNSSCVKCSKKGDCGAGYKDIKSWTGRGDNWHACAKRESRDQASASNEAACKAWCDNNSQCKHCSKKYGCGRGYKMMKSWKGKGDNWHACRKR